MSKVLMAAVIVLAVAASTSASPASTEAWLAKTFPTYEIRLQPDDAQHGDPFDIEWFRYKNKTSDWPYGTGLLLSEKGKPVWSYLHRGELAPHSLSFTDLNGDKIPDLFFYVGSGKQASSTYAFINNAQGDVYRDTNFKLAFHSTNDHSIVVDLDHDGRPEILDSGYAGNRLNHAGDTDCLPAALRTQVVAEYARIAGAYRPLGESDRPSDLFLFDPVKIFRLNGDQAIEVTDRFPEHLAWRASTLTEAEKRAVPECRDAIKETLSYLKAIHRITP